MKALTILCFKTVCLLGFFSAPAALWAQQVVKGKIIDAIDASPVAGATVFIANTTISTISDASGIYSITVPIEGRFDIVVSHLSYLHTSRSINTPKPLHTIDFVLGGQELPEAIVTPKTHVRQRDINLFWRRLLGKLPSKKGLEVLNPEKVHFYRSQDNILTVSSREPIEVVNHEMGYFIFYYLEDFEHRYKEGVSRILGKPTFGEMTPQDSKQKEQWEKKRQEVYSVSLTRFFRALYHKNTREEGFLLVEADAVKKAYTLFPLDSILQFSENKVDVSITSYMHLGGINRYISDDAIENTYYTLSNTEQGYAAKRVVVTLPPQKFSVYSDGSYSGDLTIRDPNYSMTGLANTLPIGYR